MIRNTLIATAAISAIAIGLASSAGAKTKVIFDIGLNLGSGGFYAGPGAGFYDDEFLAAGDDDDCGWEKVMHKKWNASHTHKIVFFTKEWVCG